ncbi:hypothetical protein F66182_2032 [Fusarium sp. NRRL 66182]|nr:hypothetical protein F66182_2032 [Fusarium sp. NRRL 66182]
MVLLQIGIICFKLHTGARMDFAVRDEASRMVYFMVIAVISYTMQMMFFYNTTFQDPLAATKGSMQLAMIGTVVTNLSGLLLGCLYLFLRASKSPTGYYDDDIEVSNNLNKWGGDQNPGPQSPEPLVPRSLDLPKQVRKADSEEDLLADTRAEGKVFGTRKDILNRGLPKPLRMGSMRQPQGLPTIPQPVRMSSKESIKNFKKSMYSIFPKEEPPKSPILLPTTYRESLAKKATSTQGPDTGLLPPPALRIPDKKSHRNDASMISTATVQIGLRLSNIGDLRPSKAEAKQDTNRVHNLDCPNSMVTFFPRKTSPLAIAIVDVPGEGARYEIQDNFEKQLSEKELPPVPLSAGMNTPPETTLSSAVYSPQKQKPGSSSHKPKSGSVSSTMVHSRQGSRAGPEKSRSVSSTQVHSRQGSKTGPETGKGPWI